MSGWMSNRLPTVPAIVECFESVENELRQTLHAHNAPVGHTTLTALHTLTKLSSHNVMAQSHHQIQNQSQRQAAQSLLSFLEYRAGSVPITCDRNQIVLLLDSLRRQIRPSADDTPVTERRPKSPVCLFLDSNATSALLQEAIATYGYCLENICGLTNVVVHARSDLPVTIITDLSMLRDDAQTRDKIEQLRQIHPKARLFCQSSASHFAARLEAVRLGASRFLIEPVNVDHLIALLDGVSMRKDGEPFHALLVDDGRALNALQAHAARAAGLNVAACSGFLYPEVIVSDVYMTGCRALQLAAAQYAAVPAPRDSGGRLTL